MKIEKRAIEAERLQRPTFFYSSAREGFAQYLRRATSGSGLQVLLPAFIGWSPREGSGVLDPIQNQRIGYGYYGLNHDLTVDLKALREALEVRRYDVLVLIHYYGRTEPGLDTIRQLATAKEIVLVEDLAHGLLSALIGGVAGAKGDLSMYSLHKILPMHDGGMITYGNAELSQGATSTRPELAGQLLQYDLQSIANVRRQNFVDMTEALREDLVENGLVELIWPSLTATDVPQTLPIYVNYAPRDMVYHEMNRAGFGVVSLYHTVVPDLQGDPRARWASARVMNLPVHQDMRQREAEQLINELARLVRSGGPRALPT